MKSVPGKAPRSSLEEARVAIESFLAAMKSPVVVEDGDPPIPITPDNHSLAWRSGYLTLEVWNEERNLSRRITGIASQARGRLELYIERFGKRTGKLAILDPSVKQDLTRRSSRLTYRERFRRGLSRHFPGWRIAGVTTEPDLEHSLSPSYARALIRIGTTAWAAVGAGPESDVDGVLTFGLIWLDYLRARERRLTIEGLALFMPAGRERTTCLRLRWMNPRAARYSAFVHHEDGFDDPVDLADYGNLDTELNRCTRAIPDGRAEIEQWVSRIAVLPAVEQVSRSDGTLSLRIRGLEFARAGERTLTYGLETRREASASNLSEVIALAESIGEFRSAGARDRRSSLYTRNPEGWLESQVRAHIQQIDATLVPAPVYGQVPAFTGGDRGVIDLLACDHRGRLAVIELKASEDIHLPLQALDYWMRVRWHATRNEFRPNGYFPGVELRPDPPRLLLVAPALAFHPSNQTVLRYFAPEVEVDRIGVGLEWRNDLKVMFRHGPTV